MNTTELNNFVRKYFDQTLIRRQAGIICHDTNSSKEHRRLVLEICEWAAENNMDFFTRVCLKGNEIADVVIPELSCPIIEIRYSEKKTKEYLSEYDDLRQYVETKDPFKLR